MERLERYKYGMDAKMRTDQDDRSAIFGGSAPSGASTGVAGGVGALIRARRQHIGLSLQELADRVNCGKGYLSEIETGRRGVPREDVLTRIEQAMMFPRGHLTAAAAWERVGEIATQPGGEGVRQELADGAKSRQTLERLRAVLGAGGDAASQIAALQRMVETDEPRVSVAPISLPLEVPLINRVAAGYPREFTDLGYPARVADEYVRCPDLADPDAFAARVVGDSMEPLYREGDVVVFSPAKPVRSGMDVFARLEPDHETTFKRVYFEGAGAAEQVRLQPLNAKYPPRVMARERVAGLYAAVTVMRSVG